VHGGRLGAGALEGAPEGPVVPLVLSNRPGLLGGGDAWMDTNTVMAVGDGRGVQVAVAVGDDHFEEPVAGVPRYVEISDDQLRAHRPQEAAGARVGVHAGHVSHLG